MSTLTGNDVYGLMEAYQEVYAPQELTEEQVWEEVEEWVNTLIEEGYDLSDYTWEEMFEAYIEEQGGRGSAAVRNQNVNPNASSAVRSVFNSTIGSTPLGRVAGNMASRLSEPKGSGSRRGAAAGTRTPTPTFQNTGGYGRYGAPGTQVTTPKPTPKPSAPTLKPGSGGNVLAAPAPRNSGTRPPAAPAPAAKPAATTPAKPSGTTPTAKPTPAPSASPARPSLSSQASELRQMRARSLERQGKPLSAAVVSATAKPTAYQANSFDPFDVIKGHLLDEGYADTEEAALVIMANMSEDWRESIVEAEDARNNPEKYEIRQRQSETGGQRTERKVRDRLSTMDPEKRKKMIAQMRAVGLNV
jgi:hypothetical protein